ncbi:kinesin motor domain-containing protein [Umbelopsis sp. PMI_123]|nr:kinesin motor domain-containing protein [Umbelopsis sp. PMI_123]
MLSSTAENCPTTPTRSQRRDTEYTPSKKRMTNPSATPSRAPFRTPMHFSPSRNPPSETPVRPGQPLITSLAALAGANVAGSSFYTYDPEKEPIKAFLRIRPNLQQETEKTPYMEAVSDVEVSMLPPEDSNAYRTRNRAPERYKFTKIFHEDVSQKQFFDETALPLVQDVLNGENALLFAYGVTNSGKTYSIQGTKQDSGILPRSLDVIFNSIKQYQNDSKLKPMMHSLIVPYKDEKEEYRDILQRIGQNELAHPDSTNPNMKNEMRDYEDRDRTVVPIDTKFEYGIWVSYSEIYTEKIYDLLVSPSHDSKRTSLPLKYEFRGEHKYISGLTEVRVHNLQEAYAILHEGQRNRAIYSTLLNNTSSRSHSIFTIKVVRVMIEDKDYIIEDPSYATLSKLSIVDLAGSERHRNTLNSGQRLKEAGNINKSLMVLGQCMDILRLNQKRMDMGKKPAIVPFRHSKLTDLFKSSFQGDGKAVMIVNVNPYDTGFDENSHVMKFAAVAKDVATWRRVHPRLDLTDVTTTTRRLRTANDSSMLHDRSMIDASADSAADESDDDDTEDGSDPFVNALLAQLEEVRGKWIDAETRCATIESNIRQQVTTEMSNELRNIEAMYMASTDKENVSSKDNKGANKKQMDMSLLVEQLNMKNKTLQLEVTNLKATLNDQQTTNQSLMSKIVQLENEKAEAVRRSIQLTKELTTQPPASADPRRSRAARLESTTPYTPGGRHSKVSRPPPSMDIETPVKKLRLTDDPARFNGFLDLRRRLQRCVLKEEQLDGSQVFEIIKEIETYPDVTFDLVKDTGMGKLLKLVCSQKWNADHRGVEQTLRMLFRKFAKLTNSNSRLASSPMAVPSSQASVALVATDIGNSQDESMVPTEDPQVENSLVLAEPELEDARPKNEPSSDVIPPSPKQTSPTNHNVEDDIMEFDEDCASVPNDVNNPFLDQTSQVETFAPISQGEESRSATKASGTIAAGYESDQNESISLMSPELVVTAPVDTQQEEAEIDDFDITSYHNEMMKPTKRKRRLREKKALTAEEVKRISTDLGNDDTPIN